MRANATITGEGRLSCRTEATDESRHPDLVTSDFPKGILSLCTVWKLVCSMPQIGEQRDDLLHLSYVNSDLVQRYFLPNCVITKSIALTAPAAMSYSALHMKRPTIGWHADRYHRSPPYNSLRSNSFLGAHRLTFRERYEA